MAAVTQPVGSNVTVPYAAPWVANWNKYSTQVYNMPLLGAAVAQITVPASQWWRVIYLAAQFNTLAIAGTRAVELVFSAGATTSVRLAPSATTPVSTTTFITYALGMNTVAMPIQNGDQYLTVGLVDLLWKPKTAIQIALNSAQTGDTLAATPSLAVEIYTEFTAPDSAPVLLPTPTLT